MVQEEFQEMPMFFSMSGEQLMWCNLPEIKWYVGAPDDVYGFTPIQN
jgi:hypothetical protein